jgi:hypothetical protein
MYGGVLIKYNLEIFNADFVCREIKMCTNRNCHLDPLFSATDILDTDVIPNTMNSF